VRSERISLISNLARAADDVLPEEAVVAVSPDHPFLFSGPDILVGSRGTLVATFVVKSSEIRRPKELVARLIASRLAFPAHTKFVVIYMRGQSSMATIDGQFDEILNHDQSHEFARFLEAADSPMPRDGVPAQIRSGALVRYSALLHLFRVKHSGGTRASPIASQPSQILPIGKPWHGSPSIRSHKGFLIGIKHTQTRRALSDALNEYSIQSFNENYQLDNKVPIPRRDTPDVAIIRDLPSATLDPEKAHSHSGILWLDDCGGPRSRAHR
jgi:hypothetical protein